MLAAIASSNKDPKDVAVRIRLVNGKLMPRFVEQPSEGDSELTLGDLRVFVAPGVIGTIEVSEEHQMLVLAQASD